MANILLMIGVWITRILLPICIVITFLIFKRELNKRKQDIRIKNDPYPKWLNFWSSLTFISCIAFLSIWTMHRIPQICLYSYGFMIASWGTPGACITMYQITRLQYCFSAKQIHSDKYGYPKWLFYILYANYFVMGVYFYTVSWFVYRSWPSQYFNGCEGNTNQYGYLAYIAWIWFWIWDLFTLFLYIIKIKQIERNTSFNNDKIYRKIRFILHKMVLLTVIYEIKGFLGAALSFIFGPYPIISILSPVIVAIDVLIAVVVIYLMIEHNNDEYIVFIKIFRLKSICCCCILLNENENENETNLGNGITNNVEKVDSIDTKTTIQIPMEMNGYQEQSVQTIDTKTIAGY